MAKAATKVDESEDPREGPLHPRNQAAIIGHTQQQADFLQQLSGNKLHHTWCFCGPKGIGKATTAYHLAAHILSAGQNLGHTKKIIETKTHPDLCVIERELADGKTKRLRDEISVETARGLVSFMRQTSISGRKVAIVDAADDLSSESANALLKQIEEPTPNSYILLVNHNPARLLPTVRSRCVTLNFNPLPAAEFTAVLQTIESSLAENFVRSEANIAAARGSVGRYLQLSQSTAAKAFSAFMAALKIEAEAKRQNEQIRIADQFVVAGTSFDDIKLLTELLLDEIAQKTKSNGNLDAAQIFEHISGGLAQAVAYNLDKKSFVMQTLLHTSRALLS